MAKAMKWAAAGSLLLSLAFIGMRLAGLDWAISFAITFFTCFYHFAMRLTVGWLLNCIMHNKANYAKGWYQLKSFEIPIYKALQVKKWKSNMPTYDPSAFDPKLHTWEEIAQAMCQAELVHEIIVLFSFLPLLAAIPFGAFSVFLITSLLAALYDLSFVIIQRYNRSRIIKILRKNARV